MLYHIVSNDAVSNDAYFEKMVKEIKYAFYPKQLYLDQGISVAKIFDTPPREFLTKEIIQKRTNAELDTAMKAVCSKALYSSFKKPSSKTPEKLLFPFLSMYHGYFLKRMWDIPTRYTAEKQASAKQQNEFFNLLKSDDNSNSSKYEGNYHHFTNVVMAAARLIQFFKNPENVNVILNLNDKDSSDEKTLSNKLSYKEAPSKRTFMLMLAAFYHDIGKSVVDHRHGIEGSVILADHATVSLYHLNQIIKSYNPEHKMEREDLLFIADMLYYHDAIGTMGTGENGYLRLVDLLERIKRYCRMDDGEENPEDLCKRTFFDLWVLNIADIIVSTLPQDKWKSQEEWDNSGSSVEIIQKFFKGIQGKDKVKRIQGKDSVYDIGVVFDLISSSDDPSKSIEEKAHTLSKCHSIDRLRRLLYASIDVPLKEMYKKVPQKKKELEEIKKKEEKELTVEDKKSIDKLESFISKESDIRVFLDSLRQLIEKSDGYMNSIVNRSIHASGDLQEFTYRLSWIGQMDYALGFFRKISARALAKVIGEIGGISVTHTGWIVPSPCKCSTETHPTAPDEQTPFNIQDQIQDLEYIGKTNAQFFMDNFAITVVQIIEHLLSREHSLHRIKNLEFEETRDRLTDEKIDQIISLEGPFRSQRSIQLLLETVFIY